MSVRAKFRVDEVRCTQISRYKEENGKYVPEGVKEMRTVIMLPVGGTSEENKKFWDASPSGRLELGTINPEAWEQLKLGEEYYIDFTHAPKPEIK